MWTNIKAVSLPLFCFANFAACVITLLLTWNAPPQPTVILPLKENAKWGSCRGPQLISPDGRWLYAEASADGKNELIEWANNRRLVLETGHMQRGAFSPDGKFFVAVHQHKLCVWDLATAAEHRIFSWRLGEHGAVHFSPDGKYALVLSFRWDTWLYFHIWDMTTQQLHDSVWKSELFGHKGYPYLKHAVWGFKHTILVEKANIDRDKNTSRAEKVCCWDVQKGRVRFEIGNLVNGDDWNPAWGVSPDGKWCVAIVTEKANQSKELPNPWIEKQHISIPINPIVQAWDVATGKLLWQRPFPAEGAWFRLSFTPDGRKVAISSRNPALDYRSELRMWNIEDGDTRSLVEAKSKGPFGAFLLSPTGRFLQYHDRPWCGNTRWPSSPAGPQIVAGWWEVHEGKARPAITFDDEGSWYDRDGNQHRLFSPDEKNKGRFQGRVALECRGSEDGIEAPGLVASLSPDERWLAIRLNLLGPPIAEDQGMRIRTYQPWKYDLHLVDLQDGTKLPVLHDVQHWKFSPDGKTLFTTGAGQIRVWQLPLVQVTSQRWVFGLLAIALLCLQCRLFRRWLRRPP